MNTIVITGASSGIGRATARHFAERGWNVAATMRTPERDTALDGYDTVKRYRLDVTDEATIEQARDAVLDDFGSVDVVLNNAGYAVAGPFEATTEERIRRQFDTNVFGLMRVTKAFLPHFRERDGGLFINVSSMGGRITFPLISLYHATKFAVEGFSESLAYELGELGIGVKIVEPGGVDTDFSGRSLDLVSADGISDYDEMVATFMAATQAQTAGSGPDVIAEAIYTAATDGETRLRYLVGPDAEQTVGFRQQHGDDAFVAMMRERFFA